MSAHDPHLDVIIDAGRRGRAAGADGYAGFAAALSAHLARHPAMPRDQAAREVNRMLAALRSAGGTTGIGAAKAG
ncbi:MAG: hypothetical protein GVY28_01655, partial [Alphaproteobacteria bacterium]|jgi:hypothetical protein|nr:hypothetical protein [Alphaproteobacteria bacterium]